MYTYVESWAYGIHLMPLNVYLSWSKVALLTNGKNKSSLAPILDSGLDCAIHHVTGDTDQLSTFAKSHLGTSRRRRRKALGYGAVRTVNRYGQ
jgi:hypothetical protein